MFLWVLRSAMLLWQERESARGLHFFPPSEIVHIVKHRDPTVTVDHSQNKGRFWNSSEISPTAAASQTWISPSPRAHRLMLVLQWEQGQPWSCLLMSHICFLRLRVTVGGGDMTQWKNKGKGKKAREHLQKMMHKKGRVENRLRAFFLSAFSFLLRQVLWSTQHTCEWGLCPPVPGRVIAVAHHVGWRW